jgi:formylglycine-generating enzyme required for sulfatase activity
MNVRMSMIFLTMITHAGAFVAGQERVRPALLTAPFNTESAQAGQHSWSVYLGVDVTTRNTIGMDLLLIPPGEFVMGCAPEKQRIYPEQSPHHVKITQPWLLGRTEVTQVQWQMIMKNEPWKEKKTIQTGPDYAATTITWFEAAEFCNRLSEHEGFDPYYRISRAGESEEEEEEEDVEVEVAGGNGYRLPSEAEWEYSCRAGSTTLWHFGDDADRLVDYAWFDKNAWEVGERYPHEVRRKLANGFGLYDMHGNVSEYCEDRYGGAYESAAQTDPVGGDVGSFRIHRGASFSQGHEFCRSSYRGWMLPYARPGNQGFRVARSPAEGNR